jgi:hypothetical protein
VVLTLVRFVEVARLERLNELPLARSLLQACRCWHLDVPSVATLLEVIGQSRHVPLQPERPINTRSKYRSHARNAIMAGNTTQPGTIAECSFLSASTSSEINDLAEFFRTFTGPFPRSSGLPASDRLPPTIALHDNIS